MHTVAMTLACMGLSLFIWLNYGQGKDLVASQIAANRKTAGIVQQIQKPAPKPLDGWTIRLSGQTYYDNPVLVGAKNAGAKTTDGPNADIVFSDIYRFIIVYDHATITCRGRHWDIYDNGTDATDQYRQIFAQILEQAKKAKN